ncbi:MAG: hypothetical protein KC454_11045, partial [Flavobacteriales bacterium]|nr:hypothetical protein [Flavobacteriales bacterium]
NLISISNGQQNENKGRSSLKDTRNPNDVHVIVGYFQTSKDELSYSSLVKEIEEYNNALVSLNDTNSLRSIDISKLQMNNTILSVVLLELVDIQLQVAMNENSYLSLQKGIQTEN